MIRPLSQAALAAQEMRRRDADYGDVRDLYADNPSGLQAMQHAMHRARAQAIGDRWSGYFETLKGKNVDFGGWGTTKALDVPTGKTYNLDAGEVAPGLTAAAKNPQLGYLFPKGLEVEGGPFQNRRQQMIDALRKAR